MRTAPQRCAGPIPSDYPSIGGKSLQTSHTANRAVILFSMVTEPISEPIPFSEAEAVAAARQVVSDGTLAALLHDYHLSFGDLGRAIGVPRSTTFRWSRGSMPRWEHAVALGRFLLDLVGA